jgi:UDP-N-acetylglucosamine 2-epimerase (hydrolysing)
MNNERRREILFITGTRADFGKLKPLIQVVKDNGKLFSYRIFATGMHMLSLYGSTVHEIYKAGFENVYPYINQDGAVSSQMDLALANTIQGLSHYVREFAPDLIVVHGDRLEALAGAVVGCFNNILVAHVEGGEVSGTVDELLRHSISKLSHIHFVANEEARKRLVQMGEFEEHIYIIGSPDIDVMLSGKLPSLDAVQRKYEIPYKDYFIFIYHPVTTEIDDLRRNIRAVVDGLMESGKNFVVIQPNNDPGSEIIMEEYQRLTNIENFRILPSMRFEYFLTLLKHAKAIVGNSSAGIREAPVYCIPTVNIGTRQMNRFDAPSIKTIGEDAGEVLYALNHLPHVDTPSTHFGQGNSSKLFLECLMSEELWKIPKQKTFRDFVGVKS